LWLWLGGGLVTVGAALMTIAGGLDAVSKVPYSFWTSVPVIVAYIMFGLSLACFTCAIRDVQMPLAISGRRDKSDAGITELPAVDDKATPGPAITNRWCSVTENVSSDLMLLQNNSMTHPAYISRSPQEQAPASLRTGIVIACDQLATSSPTTSAIRAAFLNFLGRPEIMYFIGEMADVAGKTWRPRDENPRFNFGAVLAGEGEEEPPAAWARLLLPESWSNRFGRDPRCANLVIHVEPRTNSGAPAQPTSLAIWHQRFAQALKLPTALAQFLTDTLGLPTSSDPQAEIAIWLKAHTASLTELVDVDGFTVVPGSPQANWFMGFAVADPQGQQRDSLARTWLEQMCDTSLHLDGYESALAALGPTSHTSPSLQVSVEGEQWEVWQGLAYIVALRVKITNTTGNVIRLAGIGFRSDWEGVPPISLPIISSSEKIELERELDTIRRHRYSPDLASHSYVQPHDSVTGWVTSGMARPAEGGTPKLTVDIRDAIGRHYVTIIPRKYPQVFRTY